MGNARILSDTGGLQEVHLTDSARNESRRAIWARGVALLVFVGVVGHVFYWYWPRRRASIPSSESPVANLVLREAGSEIRVWIPFPHQNLGSLEGRLGDPESMTQSVQEFLGASQRLELPSFGPFRVPPATEMALATDRAGTGFVAAARVYPVVAWLFRAAGFLASNPWMGGGDLTLGGREIRVEWRGDLWIARTAGVELDLTSGRAAVGQSLMLLRLGPLPGPVSGGLYRLAASGNRMALTSNLSGGPSSPPGIEPLRFENMAFVWTHLEGSGEARAVHSLVAFSGGSSRRQELPALVVAGTAGSDLWPLPGERVLDAIGAQVFKRSQGRWELRSYDPDSLRRGEDLVAGLEALALKVGPSPAVTIGYIDLVEARQIVLGVGEAIHRVPVIGENEARKWLAFARILEDMAGISGLFLWVAEPDQLELQVWPAVAD